jgi:regulator of sirC expression with transglutaminase-like and TPR domain
VLAVREERVSPEAAALLIARDARPELSVEAELARIDALAEPLGKLDPELPAKEQARELASHLFERLGFRGNEEDYYDPRNSYLDEVLTRRAGIPISLAVLLAAVGRRAGLEVDGIGFPGHFLARVGGEGGVFVDPFFGGRVLGEPDLARLAHRMLGGADRLVAAHLAPVGLRALVVRMLLNLKNAHERRGDHARALVCCDRLVDLAGTPALRRDRGLHALALGANAQAVEDLGAYLAAEPGARDAEEVRALLRAAEDRSSSPPS